VVQRARGKALWNKILERDQICNLFWGKGYPKAINALRTHRCPWIWVISSCAKDMAKLMGCSTPVDLGHDVLDFGYDVLDKARRMWKRIKTNPKAKCEVTW
jgi:hypothetical protein